MISLFRRNSTDTTAAARALYAVIVDQSRQPGFFTSWGIPDTPNGRFEVLVLHVFLVMHRMRDDADCANLARSLSEQAVLDIDRNLREMGVGDLSVGRQVKSLTEGLYGRLGVYCRGHRAYERWPRRRAPPKFVFGRASLGRERSGC